MTKNEETGESPGKGDAADPDQKKKMTKAQKKAAKIKASEKKRLSKEERRSAKTRRSKDGTFTKKDNRTHFGYKLHSSVGVDIPLIREFVVTTAALHDANVDLECTGYAMLQGQGIPGCAMQGTERDNGSCIQK